MSATALPSFTVFTKPWKTWPLERVAAFIGELGVDGVELAVRPGFQIEPPDARAKLPQAATVFARHRLAITLVGGDPTTDLIEACAQLSPQPIIRFMPAIAPNESYLDGERRWRARIAEVMPALERTGVRLGLQNHASRYVGSAAGLRLLCEGFDPRHVGVVWDPAHGSLCGEPFDLALDQLGGRLVAINLKNAIWRQVSGPEAEEVRWERYWTAGRMGITPWSAVAREYVARGLTCPVHLFAEYADHDAAERLIRDDIAHARAVFERASAT